MKPRILNYRVAATHETISTLNSVQQAVSISDFDAFVFEPDGIMGDALTSDALQRKSEELRDLVQRKGGIVICLLRPNDWRIGVANFGNLDKYWLLEAAAPQPVQTVKKNIKSGAGSSITYIQSARGPTSEYIRVLRRNLQFAAYLSLSEPQVAQQSGIAFGCELGRPCDHC